MKQGTIKGGMPVYEKKERTFTDLMILYVWNTHHRTRNILAWNQNNLAHNRCAVKHYFSKAMSWNLVKWDKAAHLKFKLGLFPNLNMWLWSPFLLLEENLIWQRITTKVGWRWCLWSLSLRFFQFIHPLRPSKLHKWVLDSSITELFKMLRNSAKPDSGREKRQLAFTKVFPVILFLFCFVYWVT